MVLLKVIFVRFTSLDPNRFWLIILMKSIFVLAVFLELLSTSSKQRKFARLPPTNTKASNNSINISHNNTLTVFTRSVKKDHTILSWRLPQPTCPTHPRTTKSRTSWPRPKTWPWTWPEIGNLVIGD